MTPNDIARTCWQGIESSARELSREFQRAAAELDAKLTRGEYQMDKHPRYPDMTPDEITSVIDAENARLADLNARADGFKAVRDVAMRELEALGAEPFRDEMGPATRRTRPVEEERDAVELDPAKVEQAAREHGLLVIPFEHITACMGTGNARLGLVCPACEEERRNA